MREIKFKGKRKHGPEILIGDLNHIYEGVYIFPRGEESPCNSPEWFEVDPETVGQFTGLKDSLGTDIFEGDIIEYDYEYDSDYDGDIPIIKHSTGRHVIRDIFDRSMVTTPKSEGGKVLLIGNKHVNPDLCKPS